MAVQAKIVVAGIATKRQLHRGIALIAQMYECSWKVWQAQQTELAWLGWLASVTSGREGMHVLGCCLG